MKRSRILAVTLTAAIILPSVVSAQAARNTKEWIQNNAQIASGKKMFERDRQEIVAFAALLDQLDASRESRDAANYSRLHADIRAAMSREHDQARQKTAQAGREVRQSRREKRGERQEAATTGRVVDHVQLADDRRDLRDDKRDRRHAAARAGRMNTIIKETEALQIAIDSGEEAAYVKDRRLLGEFLELMRADLRATSVELGEDRRERREDRRERRTDRRK